MGGVEDVTGGPGGTSARQDSGRNKEGTDYLSRDSVEVAIDVLVRVKVPHLAFLTHLADSEAHSWSLRTRPPFSLPIFDIILGNGSLSSYRTPSTNYLCG